VRQGFRRLPAEVYAHTSLLLEDRLSTTTITNERHSTVIGEAVGSPPSPPLGSPAQFSAAGLSFRSTRPETLCPSAPPSHAHLSVVTWVSPPHHAPPVNANDHLHNHNRGAGSRLMRGGPAHPGKTRAARKWVGRLALAGKGQENGDANIRRFEIERVSASVSRIFRGRRVCTYIHTSVGMFVCPFIHVHTWRLGPESSFLFFFFLGPCRAGESPFSPPSHVASRAARRWSDFWSFT
jgi:hypothetical protein